MQFMPPGSVGRTTRATFEKLSQRGQEWGDWQEQEEIAHAITTFRRELRVNSHRAEKWCLMEKHTAITTSIQSMFGQQVEFLQRLVRARSSNPFLPESSPPDVPVEEEVAAVIQQELHHLGLPGRIDWSLIQAAQMSSAIFLDQGKTEKTLILTTHMDTVEPSDYTRDPWGAQIEGGRLYGVGAADAKAQIAAFVYAIHALRKAGIHLGRWRDPRVCRR